jgi:hypothetical protein
MKMFEFINEVSTPTGSIFLRFKEKMGSVSPHASAEEKRKAIYLTAYAGFANAPEDLKQAQALRNFSNLKNANDLVEMIKSIMTDKTFLSAKSITIYDDLTDPTKGDNSAPFKRHPFLLKFFKWVEREGGDRLKIVDKADKEGPLKAKRPRKENPMYGKKIRDVEKAETKHIVTFTVDNLFYRTIEDNFPNLMKFRGGAPGRSFTMDEKLFDKFMTAAKEKYPNATINIVKRVQAESLATPSGPNWDTNGGHHSLDESEQPIGERGKVSRAFCTDPSRPRSKMGASQLSSCISQGFLPHDSGKSVRFSGKRIKLRGKKLKGEKYGGPKSTKAG